MTKRSWALVGVTGTSLVACLGTAACYRVPGTSAPRPIPATDAELSYLQGVVGELSEEIGERNLPWHPLELREAERFIIKQWEHQGYAAHRHTFDVDGEEAVNPWVSVNAGPKKQLVVVGAHYDTAPGTPGADDNATGVAVLLSLSKAITSLPSECHEVRFVAFTNEEPPFFARAGMGSKHYADWLAAEGRDVALMWSLETLGMFREEEGTQHYPFPFSLIYPNTGDFLGFVGIAGTGSGMRQSIAAYREVGTVPSVGAVIPGVVTGVDWSDHRSFHAHGWPSVMITDTAIFRNEHYHTRSDTAEHLNFPALAQVTEGLEHALRRVACPSQ